MRKFSVILAAIAFISLNGCGQYGPLHLPHQPAPKDQQDTEFDAQPASQNKSRQP